MINLVFHFDGARVNSQNKSSMGMAAIGIGNMGCNTIDILKKKNLNIKTIAIDTDLSKLNRTNADIKIHLKGTNNFGCGGDPELGYRITMASINTIDKIIREGRYAIIFIIVGLGGGIGTGGAPILAEIASKIGSAVISVATLPFSWDVSRRLNALRAMESLKSKSHTLIVLDNDKLVKITKELPYTKAFSVMDHIIVELISSVYEILFKPSEININVQDFINFVKRGGLSTVLFADYSGNDPKRVVAEAFNNPLIDVDFSRVDGAIIHITIDSKTQLSTAFAIIDEIKEFISKDALITFGLRVSPTFNDRIKLICVLSGVNIPHINKL